MKHQLPGHGKIRIPTIPRSQAKDSAAGPSVQSFNLTRWFTILALTAIVIITATSGVIRYYLMVGDILQRNGEVTMQFVATILKAADEKHASEPHHTNVTAVGHFLNRDHDRSRLELDEFFRLIAGMPDVLRTNVYAEDRTIVWSSSPELIGKRFPDNEELDGAYKGKLEVHMGDTGDLRKDEHIEFEVPDMKFVENYLPIWDAAKSRVVGVAEIYTSPASVFAAIDAGTRTIAASAVLGAAFLFAVLFWVVRRADLIMRRQQAELIESQTMATIGEVAAAVAHGFRNPLASIRSSAELVQSSVPKEVQEPIADIIASADRMENSVRDLLAYSRPREGQFEAVQINDLIAASVLAATNQAERSGTKLVTSTRADLPLARGVPPALEHVLNGLVSNALAAMPNGGKLVLSSDLSEDAKFIEVKVADTGPGIPEAQMAEVFKPYFTTKNAGLGLGLALAKSILERHRGSAELTSKPGQGTVATLQIPVFH